MANENDTPSGTGAADQDSSAPKRPTVAVVGAGIAGMAAAVRLAQRGFDVTVFEERISLGGKLGAHRRRWFPREGERPRLRELRPLSTGKRLSPGNRKHIESIAAESRTRLAEWREAVLSKSAERAEVRNPPAAPAPNQRDTKWEELRPEPDSDLTVKLTFDDKTAFFVNNFAPRFGPDTWEVGGDVFHEHCYHMFLDWYHNFWDLMSDAGCPKATHFEPRNEVGHLLPGEGGLKDRMKTLKSLGSLTRVVDNLNSGVLPVPELFLWFYSMKDLASQPLNQQKFLDNVSVNGFMGSRWYASEPSAKFHEEALTKAFSIPSYLISASAYRDFARFNMKTANDGLQGAKGGNAMLWVLKTNSNDGIFAPLEKLLTETIKKESETKSEIKRGTRVTRLEYYKEHEKPAATTADRRIKLYGVTSDIGGDPEQDSPAESGEQQAGGSPWGASVGVFDYVVMAVPPKGLATILRHSDDVIPGLEGVRKLQSGITAALDLHFNKKLEIDLPEYHVILRDSRYGLSFIDNSQLWKEHQGRKNPSQPTHLSIGVTDFHALAGMNKAAITAAIIDELRRYIDFDPVADIDFSRTYLQRNDREPLFVNEVGSELWRPKTKTEHPNVFLAGDYCDNPINIATVEGAVVSGLQAARAVQARYRADLRRAGRPWSGEIEQLKPINIRRAETYHAVNAKALKLGMMPYAMAAKSWSRISQLGKSPSSVLTPSELHAIGTEVAQVPSAMVSDIWGLGVESVRWWADIALGSKKKS